MAELTIKEELTDKMVSEKKSFFKDKIWKFIKEEFFIGWTPFQTALLGVATTLIIALAVMSDKGNMNQTSLMAMFAGVFGFFGVMQGARQKISTFIIGTIGGALYATLSFGEWHNLANAVYQVGIGIPMNFVGFYLWFAKRDKAGNVLPKRMSNQGMGLVLIAFIAFYLIYSFNVPMREGIKTEQHWVDALVLTVMVFATFVMLGRYIEQWYFWIGANFAQIALYAVMIATLTQTPGAYGWTTIEVASIGLVNYIASQINAFYGLYHWWKYYKSSDKYEFKVLTSTEIKKLNSWNKVKYFTDKFFTKHTH